MEFLDESLFCRSQRHAMGSEQEGNSVRAYLSPAEVKAVQVLHKHAPYSIDGISQSMFSVARHYGGMTYQGCHYTYVQPHDECVRDDVLKLVARLRKLREKMNRAFPYPEQAQFDLPQV